MSSAYDKLFGGPTGDEPVGIPIDGAFCCHVCNEVVDEATWYQDAKLLMWKCEDGHVSKIEEFTF
jgi:hypothetical protein